MFRDSFLKLATFRVTSYVTSFCESEVEQFVNQLHLNFYYALNTVITAEIFIQ